MKTVIALYTATGNTLYVASQFKDKEIHFIDKILDGSDKLPDKIDRLGIMFPVYNKGIPQIVANFVNTVLKERDNSDIGYVFAFTTNGGNPYSHLYSFDKLLQNINLNLSYAATVKLPYTNLKKHRKLTSEMETLAFANKMKRKTDKIIEEIENETIKLPKALPFARTIGALSRKANRKYKDNKLTLDSSKCTKCNVCYHICPLNNIEKDTIKFKDKCSDCYACYHRCPEHALLFKDQDGQYLGLQDTEVLWRR